MFMQSNVKFQSIFFRVINSDSPAASQFAVNVRLLVMIVMLLMLRSVKMGIMVMKRRMMMSMKRRILMMLMKTVSRKMMLGPPAQVSLAPAPARGGISASLTSSLTDQCCLLECKALYYL